MTGELTNFLKGYVKAADLFADENFLPANRMGDHPENPNVIGMYMGKEWEYVERGSEYVRPVDRTEPPVMPHRR